MVYKKIINKNMSEFRRQLISTPDNYALELLATRLCDYCYSGMFLNCSKLENITMLAMDISSVYKIIQKIIDKKLKF